MESIAVPCSQPRAYAQKTLHSDVAQRNKSDGGMAVPGAAVSESVPRSLAPAWVLGERRTQSSCCCPTSANQAATFAVAWPLACCEPALPIPATTSLPPKLRCPVPVPIQQHPKPAKQPGTTTVNPPQNAVYLVASPFFLRSISAIPYRPASSASGPPSACPVALRLRRSSQHVTHPLPSFGSFSHSLFPLFSVRRLTLTALLPYVSFSDRRPSR